MEKKIIDTIDVIRDSVELLATILDNGDDVR